MIIIKIITILQPNHLAMIKVEKSKQIIKPFGGINFVIDDIKAKGISELIDNHLGSRASQAEYSYSDIFLALKEEGIRVYRSRADAGSYGKKIIDIVEKYSQLFYIRAQKSETMREEIQAVTEWKEVEINNIEYQVSSVDYTPFGGKKTYRLVIQRTKENQGQGNLFTEDARVYRSILTNDTKSSEKKIIEFYNARGTSEKIFDVMNNDFGWSKLPFSFMNENTVFLIVMAMCRSVFQWLLIRYSKVFTGLKPTYRLKKFIFRFIAVCTKWVKGQRGIKLKIFDDREYEKTAAIPL